MCQINNPEIYDRICALYFELLSKAGIFGLTKNIEIHMRQNLANELDLGDTLTVGFGDCVIEDVPIVIDNTIKEKIIHDGLQSDILLFDPEWITEEKI